MIYLFFIPSILLFILAWHLRKKEKEDLQVTKISTQELVKHINKEI